MKRIFAKTISLMLILSIFMSIPAWAETETPAEPTPTATTNTDLLDIEQYQFMRNGSELKSFSGKENTQFLMPVNISTTTPTTKYTYTINNTDNTDSTKTGTVPLYENAVDNIVVVENKKLTGSDVSCYFRTIFAVECPEGLSNGVDVLLSRNETDYIWTPIQGFATINDVRFKLYVAEYKEVLDPGEVAPASLYQLYLPAQASSEDAALFGEGLDVMVISQCIQSEGFDTLDEAMNKLGEISATNHPFEEDNWLMALLKRVFTNK